MNLFQWLAIPLLGALLMWELVGFWVRPASRRFRFFRCCIWFAAAIAITYPSFIQRIASAIGIGRGADVVLYLFVLASIGTSFVFYSRYVHMQRQVTELVRHIALQEARRGKLDETGGT
jgi:hypothetical protein